VGFDVLPWTAEVMRSFFSSSGFESLQEICTLLGVDKISRIRTYGHRTSETSVAILGRLKSNERLKLPGIGMVHPGAIVHVLQIEDEQAEIKVPFVSLEPDSSYTGPSYASFEMQVPSSILDISPIEVDYRPQDYRMYPSITTHCFNLSDS